MTTKGSVHELASIDRWARHFSRAPHQHNVLHGSDAEMIALPGTDRLLAITIDTIAEEIVTGLYREPFTMGWVTVMASLSDLAAVGAGPLGLVVSITVEPSRDEEFRSGLAQGMAAACDTCGTYLLGGDTNTAASPSLTGCAIGTVPRDSALTRLGCRPGDRAFLSGPAGCGSALGLARFLGSDDFAEADYRPVARLGARRLLRRFATVCMDTSDGVLPTLDQLMRLNNVGFRIECDVEELLDPRVCRLASAASMPPWFMLAGPHGEFELVFTVPGGLADEFTAEARSIGWDPLPLARVTEEACVSLPIKGRYQAIDTAALRNLFDDVGGDIRRFVQGLAVLPVCLPEVNDG